MDALVLHYYRAVPEKIFSPTKVTLVLKYLLRYSVCFSHRAVLFTWAGSPVISQRNAASFQPFDRCKVEGLSHEQDQRLGKKHCQYLRRRLSPQHSNNLSLSKNVTIKST